MLKHRHQSGPKEWQSDHGAATKMIKLQTKMAWKGTKNRQEYTASARHKKEGTHRLETLKWMARKQEHSGLISNHPILIHMQNNKLAITVRKIQGNPGFRHSGSIANFGYRIVKSFG